MKGQCVQHELCPSCNLIVGEIIKTPIWVVASPFKVCAAWERAGCWKPFFNRMGRQRGTLPWDSTGSTLSQFFPSAEQNTANVRLSKRIIFIVFRNKKWILLKWPDLWRAEELKEWEMYYFAREGKSLMQSWTEFSNMGRIYMKHTEATFDVSSWK